MPNPTGINQYSAGGASGDTGNAHPDHNAEAAKQSAAVHSSLAQERQPDFTNAYRGVLDHEVSHGRQSASARLRAIQTGR